jgi:glycosyltransferase involved in cell wall biosynthesis
MEHQSWPQRLALITDAWTPQVNGVARSLARLVDYHRERGMEILVIAPDRHKTVGLVSYPEIQVAADPWSARSDLVEFAPHAVHLATEGPLGFWARSFLGRRELRFTSSFHTKYPEYITARFGIPANWSYHLVRWFHGGATRTLVSTRSMERELAELEIGRERALWPRGVDSNVFHPKFRDESLYGLPGPIWLFVGRVAVEKNLEEFLSLRLPGTKVVVGDGPSRPALQAQFPDVVWRGFQAGPALSAHFASADYFVFPSRTETFGNVLLEALASGLPVAAIPAPGSLDFVIEGQNGSIDNDLAAACARVRDCSKEAARRSALQYDVRRGHDVFAQWLEPVHPCAKSSDDALRSMWRAVGVSRSPRFDDATGRLTRATRQIGEATQRIGSATVRLGSATRRLGSATARLAAPQQRLPHSQLGSFPNSRG